MQQHQLRQMQDWLNLFEQQKQSGPNAVEFCRQQQINIHTYCTQHARHQASMNIWLAFPVKREVTNVESYTEVIAGLALNNVTKQNLPSPFNYEIYLGTIFKLFRIRKTKPNKAISMDISLVRGASVLAC